jgi:FlgD Ig-like domain
LSESLRRGSARAAPLAQVVFALLVIASFAAFGVTQRLKHTPTAVQSIYLSPSFAPGAQGDERLEHISFRINRDDRVRVSVIDSEGNTIRTLAHRRPLHRYRRAYFVWDGHATSGAVAPTGAYRVRVTLLGAKREVLSPSSFQLKAPPGGGR